MNALEQLAVALGLAGLCGINLYLTVFATGLAVRMGWLVLDPQFQQLGVLGETPILAIAGTLYVLEFFADKVPWVDSMNDAVHTLIRPVGAAFLSIQVLGNVDPVFDVVVGLLSGGVALTTHAAKAGTRLMANASPEPISNIALSVTEDVVVLGGLAMVYQYPYVSLAALIIVLAVIIYFGPRMLRLMKSRVWFAWRKLSAPALDKSVEISAKLPPHVDMIFQQLTFGREKVAWAIPCVSSASKQIPGHLHGWLVGTDAEEKTVHFVAPRRGRAFAKSLELRGYKAGAESRFLTENLVFYPLQKGQPKFVFQCDRPRRGLVEKVATLVQERLESTPQSSERQMAAA